jgi:hypothetical protein
MTTASKGSFPARWRKASLDIEGSGGVLMSDCRDYCPQPACAQPGLFKRNSRYLQGQLDLLNFIPLAADRLAGFFIPSSMHVLTVLGGVWPSYSTAVRLSSSSPKRLLLPKMLAARLGAPGAHVDCGVGWAQLPFSCFRIETGPEIGCHAGGKVTAIRALANAHGARVLDRRADAATVRKGDLFHMSFGAQGREHPVNRRSRDLEFGLRYRGANIRGREGRVKALHGFLHGTLLPRVVLCAFDAHQ